LQSLNLSAYNESEFYSYKSAKALKDYVNYLKGTRRLMNYSVNVYAHSQGGAVSSEALRDGLKVLYG